MAVDREFDQASAERKRAAELARWVRALRKERKWSQETLAKRSSVHRNTISRLETHPEMVTMRAVYRVGVALGIPDWEILRSADETAKAA